jgi:hypothetical protein
MIYHGPSTPIPWQTDTTELQGGNFSVIPPDREDLFLTGRIQPQRVVYLLMVLGPGNPA